jgi:hypothetical protein
MNFRTIKPNDSVTIDGKKVHLEFTNGECSLVRIGSGKEQLVIEANGWNMRVKIPQPRERWALSGRIGKVEAAIRTFDTQHDAEMAQIDAQLEDHAISRVEIWGEG